MLPLGSDGLQSRGFFIELAKGAVGTTAIHDAALSEEEALRLHATEASQNRSNKWNLVKMLVFRRSTLRLLTTALDKSHEAGYADMCIGRPSG